MNTKHITISFVIPNKDDFKRLKKCISFINLQEHKFEYEIIIADSGFIKKYPSDIVNQSNVKIINLGFQENQEARKFEAILKAKFKYICMLDTDNYLDDQNWLQRMIEPLIMNEDIIYSFSNKYKFDNTLKSLDKYFALLGGYDPVVNFLKKNDRIGFFDKKISPSFNLITEFNNYYEVTINYNFPPVIGANGFIFKKDILNLYKIESSQFNHNDYFLTLFKKQTKNKIAIIKNSLIHNTSNNFIPFVIKRLKNMNNLKTINNSKLNFPIFNSKSFNDYYHLTLYIIYTVSLFCLLDSLYKMIVQKKKEWIWHPIICIIYLIIYAIMIITSLFRKND